MMTRIIYVLCHDASMSRHVMACAPERERLGLRQAKLGRISQRVARDELRRL
jgi:hypothetical protein